MREEVEEIMGVTKYPLPSKFVRYVPMAKDRANEVTVRKVMAYRDTVWIGEELRIPQGRRARIIRKHPWIVETSKGVFQWIDLYLMNTRNVDSTESGYEYFEL